MTGKTILPLIWEIPVEVFKQIPSVVQYKMPEWASNNLLTWQYPNCSDRDKRSLKHRDLGHILGWLAPEIGYVDNFMGQLSFIFFQEVMERGETGKRIREALNLWMSITVGDISAQERRKISDTALDKDNWVRENIDYSLNVNNRACLSPENRRVFDALTLLAAEQLSGTQLESDERSSGLLVPTGYKGSPYGGRELITFPPISSTNQKRQGYWSEVLNVSTITTPEADTLRLVADISIRNFGPVTRKTRPGVSRTIDVFYKVDDHSEKQSPYRHGALKADIRRDKNEVLIPEWKDKHITEVLEVINRMSGSSVDFDSVINTPLTGERGGWAIPRLSKGQSDYNLPGGTGVPWPDRRAFAEHMDRILEPLGIQRVTSAERVQHRVPIALQSPFVDRPPKPKLSEKISQEKHEERVVAYEEKLKKPHAECRSLILKALRKHQSGDTLKIIVFQLQENTPELLIDTLESILGKADKNQKNFLTYQDGLKIEILSEKSGVLNEQLPKRPDRSSITRPLSNQQKEKILSQEYKTQLEEHLKTIDSYIENVISKAEIKGLWLSIIELHDALLENSSLDPYAHVYRGVAKHQGLPQVVLVGLNRSSEMEDSDEDDFAHKAKQAILDGFRMLGVPPISTCKLNDTGSHEKEFQFLAPFKLSRNKEWRGQDWRERILTPAAVLFRDGEYKVALMDKDKQPIWMPYSQACKRILLHEFFNLSNLKVREDERKKDMETFFAQVFNSLELDRETVVLADAENIRAALPFFSNECMTFGNFKARDGNDSVLDARFKDNQGPISVVRMNTEAGKRPSYYFNSDQNTIQGTFVEPGRKRTFWQIRSRSKTMQRGKYNLSESRHQNKNVSDFRKLRQIVSDERTASIMEELAVLVESKEMSPSQLAKLISKLRKCHVTYTDETILPFPLHEASLLKKMVK